ncbi:DNA/RNA nuclease SfsA [Spirulina subsalsa FACHB-351]|uniref:Sugar fermentation stimulation protein homolog n=1 Tax=Spirulina subsalsa FACHB-351 TaxID=234711 RepID=A0ABT3L6F3_9CYAN|nr:DNA/RNA nuclease SfsA [Spirulina subsalsa]MCW6037079.1 DNA/RNA nuclease SfsA [Spirulina subsalsa FACHB-351]
MSSPLIYTYPPLEAGILVRRYKRFFAEIELTSGEVITAHCPNTGPMTDVCTVGSLVQVSRSDNPKRKLAYTWEMIQVEHPQTTWVGVNTGLPNRVMRSLLEQKQLPELASRYDTVRREVVYGSQGKSRVDFLLTSTEDHPPLYLEVKNVTWTQGQIAVFPDTVTTRGQKHLGDLMGVLGEAKAAIVYFINRGDCEQFAPGDSTDPKYGELLRQAYHQGVEVYPYRFQVTPEGLYFLGLAELLL